MHTFMRLRWFAVTLLAVLGLSSSAMAALIVVEFNNPSGGNVFPWGQSAQRHLMGFSTTHMQNTKGAIVEIGFQFTAAVNRTWPNVEIYMGESDIQPNSFSLDFSANYDSNGRTQVKTGQVAMSAPDANTQAYFTLDTPYKYSGQKPLIIEVIVFAASSGSGATSNRFGGAAPGGQGFRTWNSSTTATAGSGSSVNWGIGSGFKLQQGATWTGAVNTDWNNPGNWDGFEVPDKELGAEIPDSTTTPNSPTLPNGGDVLDIVLKPSAILNGGSGRITIWGNWENQGGQFNHGTSMLEFGGDTKQEINSGGVNIGNVQVTNTTDEVHLTAPITALCTGTFEIFPGAVVRTVFPVHELTGLASFNNNGTLILENTGVFGLITKAGQNFGRVLGIAATINEVLVFQGPTIFGDGTVFSGQGMVQFQAQSVSPTTANITYLIDSISTFDGASSILEHTAGDMIFRCASGGTAGFANNAKSVLVDTPVGSDITFTNTCTYSGKADYFNRGSVNVNGDVNASVVEFRNEGPVNIQGDVVANTIIFANTGLVTIGGNIRALTGNITISGDALISSNGTLEATNGTIVYSGNLDLTVGGLAGNIVQLAGNGMVTVNGDIDVTEFTNQNMADVTVTGTLAADIATLNSPADFSVAGSVTVLNQFQLQSTGNTNFSNAFTVRGDMIDTATGSFTVGQTFTINGQGQKIQVTSENHVMRAVRLVISGTSLVRMSGSFLFTSTNPVNPAVRVDTTAGLELIGVAEIRVGQGNSGRVRISGVLATEEDGSSGTLERPIVGGATGAQAAVVEFTATSALAVNGIVFDAVGPASQPYAVIINDGATINAFNKVSILGANASIAAINLATDIVPKRFNNLEFESTNASIANIDASLISPVEQIFVTKGENNGGNYFGTSREFDPNDAIVWDDPSQVTIQTDARLPGAEVGMPYTVVIQVLGGNRPYQFVITQKPEWLTLDPVAGVISGQPELHHVGSYQFPVTVIDASQPNQSISKVFTLQVSALAGVDLSLLNFGLSRAKEGEIYSHNLIAAGGLPPYTFTRVGTEPLPLGLSLSPTGSIFGVPISGTRGIYTVRVRAQDSSSPTQTIESEMQLTVQSDLADPEFLALASKDPGSGCVANTGAGTSWLWLIGAAGGVLALRSRRRINA